MRYGQLQLFCKRKRPREFKSGDIPREFPHFLGQAHFMMLSRVMHLHETVYQVTMPRVSFYPKLKA